MARDPISVNLRSAQSTPLSGAQNDQNLTVLRDAIERSSEAQLDSGSAPIPYSRTAESLTPSTIKNPSYYVSGEFTEIKTCTALGLPAGTGNAVVVTYGDSGNAVKQEAYTQNGTTPLKFIRYGSSTNWGQWYYVALSLDPSISSPWSTGDVKLSLSTVRPAGWVWANDGTIGPNGSAATSFANNTCLALYTLLWALPPAFAPVVGSRGGSAAADWAAGKPIQAGTFAGRALAATGQGAGLTLRALADLTGEEKHTLLLSEIPLHGHPSRINYGAVTADNHGAIVLSSNTRANYPAFTGPLSDTIGEQIGGSGGNLGTGATDPHNVMQPSAFLNLFMKL